MQAELAAPAAHRRLIARHQMRDARIGETLALQAPAAGKLEAVETLLAQQLLFAQQVLDLRQEPGVDLGRIEDLLQRPAGAESIGHVQDPIRSGPAQLVGELVGRLLGQAAG